ncbi:MAG: helix-turn-helix domain-containing protein [Pseudomonadota bacterium]
MKYKLMTLKEVAEHFCVSEMTVRRWVWSQKLPAYKPRGELRFKESDVYELLEESRYKVAWK